MKVKFYSDRFILRELSANDVTSQYLGWLQDVDAKKYITAASHTSCLSDLKQYVCSRIGREDILFLGIFDKSTGLHIGNIKYEPVNSALGFAVMGILIGNPAFRGKGVATEVLNSSAQWLKTHRNIDQILLGVSKYNIKAIRSYEKTGFVIADSPYLPISVEEQIIMSWDVPDEIPAK
ncbi:MAG: GNAT family protein [Dissulfurispiraceae bacterium]|jgi:RimJ/RimL family protein N-acetyltransferase|nr:GNAT family protein [Dissulfurispiraceae bacterium]